MRSLHPCVLATWGWDRESYEAGSLRPRMPQMFYFVFWTFIIYTPFFCLRHPPSFISERSRKKKRNIAMFTTFLKARPRNLTWDFLTSPTSAPYRKLVMWTSINSAGCLPERGWLLRQLHLISRGYRGHEKYHTQPWGTWHHTDRGWSIMLGPVRGSPAWPWLSGSFNKPWLCKLARSGDVLSAKNPHL